MRHLLLIAALLPLLACQNSGAETRDEQAVPPRTVTVSGEGEVLAAPDLARLQFAIELDGPQPAELQQQAARIMHDFLALADRLGIPAARIQTSQIDLQPRYHWDEGRRVHDGYLLRRFITAELRQLDKLGHLLEAAVALGVNSLSPPELASSRATSLEREALAAAATDARERARVLATRLGAELGPVRRIIERSGAAPVPMERTRMAIAQETADAAAGYQTGQIRFRAEVEVSFDLRVEN